MDKFDVRAQELMIRGDEARRYAAIYRTGICPDCKEAPADMYETTVCRHARICTGEDSVDRAERALGVE